MRLKVIRILEDTEKGLRELKDMEKITIEVTGEAKTAFVKTTEVEKNSEELK
jgi:hypothetical protein